MSGKFKTASFYVNAMEIYVNEVNEQEVLDSVESTFDKNKRSKVGITFMNELAGI